MIVFDEPSTAYSWTKDQLREMQTIGLAPTMGALHAGHVSLVERARQECDVVIATIFVNPTQFGPQEDFARYPRTLERDLQMLEAAGVHAVFTPSVEGLYPRGYKTFVEVEDLSSVWEGAIRPTHFRGVTTVVLKLFNIIPATHAYFGRKDLQQCEVIERMTRDLHLATRIVRCPIVREHDGLAMSSRNAYLSADERARARCLYEAIQTAERLVKQGERNSDKVLASVRQALAAGTPDAVDYAAIVDAESLETTPRIDSGNALILAARFGKTRLIDNALFA